MNIFVNLKKEFIFFVFLIKKELKSILKQSYFYISGAFFVLFCGFIHFFSQKFFSLDVGSSSLSQFFLGMPYISILVVPTLVMNTWNFQNDVFESLPVSITKNVLSKFISISILFLLILIFTLPIVFFTNAFGEISWASVFTGYFVIFLYGCCVISLCLFVFSFFQNKAVGFFVAAILLALIDTIHFLPIYVNLPSSISFLCRNLSVSWHFDAASKGILDSRDCFFYIILIFLFCVLTIFHIKSKKKGKFFKEVLFYPLISILLLVNLNLYYTRIDLTTEKQFSLSKETKSTLKELSSPIEITYYLSNDLEKIYPQVRDVKDFLYQLSYENNLVSVKTVDPKDKGLDASLARLGITSQQIQSTEENRTSVSSVFSSILIETNGKYETLPFVLGTSELEYNLLTRIKKLTSNFQMEVLILIGNELSLNNEYSYVEPWFESAGFKTRQVLAKDLETITVAPNQCLLVLGSSELTLNDAVSIETYLQNGGKALFAVSPNTVDIISSWTATNLEFDPIIDMLSTWGFTIGNQIIQDISNFRIQMYGTTDDNQIDYNNLLYVNYPFWIVTLPQFTNFDSIITENFSRFESYWASPISIKQVGDGEYTPLVYTTQQAWLQAPYSIVESEAFVTAPFSSANSKPSNVDYGQYLIAATYKGNLPSYFLTNGIENTKITVFSDQYFPSVMIKNTNSPNNLNFLVTNCIYLTDNEYLINIKNKGYSNTSLYKITDMAEFNEMKKTTIFCCMILIPLIILGIFFAQLILRKITISKIGNKK